MDGFDEVFRRHSPALRSHIAGRYQGSGADCDQIESGVWQRAWAHWAKADRPAVTDPLAWLVRNARYEYLSQARKSHRRHEVPLPDGSAAPPDPAAGSAYDPMKQTARKDRDAVLAGEVDALGDHERLLLDLSAEGWMSWDQMAYVLYDDAGKGEAVRKQYVRLLSRMRTRLQARHGSQAFAPAVAPLTAPSSDAANTARSAGEGVYS